MNTFIFMYIYLNNVHIYVHFMTTASLTCVTFFPKCFRSTKTKLAGPFCHVVAENRLECFSGFCFPVRDIPSDKIFHVQYTLIRVGIGILKAAQYLCVYFVDIAGRMCCGVCFM